MIYTDILLSVGSFLFLIKCIPQLFRNFQYRETITQSLMSNIFVLIASVLTVIGLWELNIVIPSYIMLIQIFLTLILIIQIIIWRNN